MSIDSFIRNAKDTRHFNNGFNAGVSVGRGRCKDQCFQLIKEAWATAEDDLSKELLRVLLEQLESMVIKEG